MSDIEAIRRLIALYGQLLDSGRLDDWGQLFTPDAEFRVWGSHYRGREEIVREIGGMQPPEPSKHLAASPVVDLAGPDDARAWTDFSVVITLGDRLAPVTLGRYHDRLARREGLWHFAARTIVMDGEPLPAGVDPIPFR